MHQVVTAQLAKRRAGTQSTKTRAEVRGGGRKPYKQKGTGNARQGSTRAPHSAGGGVALGPKPRKYGQQTPKKMIELALRSALSDRAADGQDRRRRRLGHHRAEDTRRRARPPCRARPRGQAPRGPEAGRGRRDQSFRNLPEVQLIEIGELNAYDVLCNDWIVFTTGTLPTGTSGEVEVTGAPTAKKAAPKKAAAKPKPAAEAPKTRRPRRQPRSRPRSTRAGRRSSRPAGIRGRDVHRRGASRRGQPSEENRRADERGHEEGPYGPGSAAATEDGSAPDGFDIKGNANSMLYHVPDSRFYEQTVAEVWFDSAESAEAAGFQLPPSQRDDATDKEGSE